MVGANCSVSVIILNWNGERWLERCISSVRETQGPSYEILVADNASTDDSIGVISRFRDVRLIRFHRNNGYALGNNLAAEFASGEFLLFLNPDTWIEQDTLQSLVNTMSEAPRAGFCAASVVSYQGIQQLNNGLLYDLFGYPVPPLVKAASNSDLFYADGCALFARASVFRRIGGFDSGHFLFAEDSDLCWRGYLLGFPTVRSSRALVHHQMGGANSYSSKSEVTYGQLHTTYRRRLYSESNQLTNILKNFSISTLVWVLPLFFALNSMECVVLLVHQRKMPILKLYPEAWIRALRRSSQTRLNRQRIQSERIVPDREVLRRFKWMYSKLASSMASGIPDVD